MSVSRSKIIVASLLLALLTLSTVVANTVNFSHVNEVNESFNVTMHFQDGSSSTVLLSADFTTNVSVSQTVTGVTVNSVFVGSGTTSDVELASLTEITVDFTGTNTAIFSELDEDI